MLLANPRGPEFPAPLPTATEFSPVALAFVPTANALPLVALAVVPIARDSFQMQMLAYPQQ